MMNNHFELDMEDCENNLGKNKNLQDCSRKFLYVWRYA